MKITQVIICTLSLITGSCSRAPQPQPTLMETSRQELAAAVEERDSLMRLVTLIADDMERIRRMENILAVDDGGSAEAHRSSILTQIAAIKKTMAQRRHQLADMEERLRQSSVDDDDLSAAIIALRRQLDNQSRDIERLRATLAETRIHAGNLAATVDSLSDTLAVTTGNMLAAEEHAARLDKELNACHYAIGTRSELSSHGILQGGFLRRTRLLEADYDSTYFTTADRRILTSIAIDARKAKLLTNHPAGSWHINDSNGLTLVIDDIDRFWSKGKMLVIQTD